MRAHHADQVFECEMCNRVHDRSLLLDHMNSHVPEEEDDEDVLEIPDLNIKENKSRPFVCMLCGYAFGYNCALKQHIMSKHSAIRAYTCLVCDKSFKTSSGLYNHRRLVHDPRFGFSCTECGQQFKLQHEYKRHVKVKHERQKSFFCDQCPKGFFIKDSLAKHKQTHVSDSQFCCNQCSFVTTQKRYLVSHMNRKHAEDLVKGGKDLDKLNV